MISISTRENAVRDRDPVVPVRCTGGAKRMPAPGSVWHLSSICWLTE
jgi:hypothetical protein